MSIQDYETEQQAQAGGAEPSINGVDINESQVQYHAAASTSPTVNDDADSPFFVGNIWIRLDTNQRWQCDVNTVGAAEWTEIPTVPASQAEMEAGTVTALRSMTPERVAQAIAALAGGGGLDYIYIRDEKASATQSGTFTSAAWQTRVLNTEVNDSGGHAALSSNQITLQAGTYTFRARGPAYQVSVNKLKLKNITDTIEYIGSNAYASIAGDEGSDSFVAGRFTIASAKVFELQHRCNTTKATNGLGPSTGMGVVEVYAEIEFWKEL